MMRRVPLAWACATAAVVVVTAGPTAPKRRFPEQHQPQQMRPRRPDQEISRTTQGVAVRLGGSVPASPGVAAPGSLVDRHIFNTLRARGIRPAPRSSDAEFCRRVHLDLTGRIPSAEALRTFLADAAPEKRERLIDQLLQSDAWVDHWAYWFGDLFRNCANRIGNPSTKHFDAWIRASLRADKPYDQMVTEMLTVTAPNSIWTPDAAPAGFLARWHVPGDTMYSDRHEDTSDEIAVQSSRLFLGVNYQCISCHRGRGFLERVNLDLVPKERSDLWAMAAFFGRTRVRIVPFQDRFTIMEDGAGYDTHSASSVRLQRDGPPVTPTFLLTGERANPALPLRPQFARMLTRHPQFARNTVNVIWKELFGLGIVDPVDSFDLARQDPANPPRSPWTVQPTHPALLRDLGAQFQKQGFRLRSLMRQLCRSQAYQLSSQYPGEWKDAYTPFFARHYIRRMTAEQLHDSLVLATDLSPNYKQKDMVYGTDLPTLKFWTQAPTPEEIGDGEAKALLRTFGQSNREQHDRKPGGSVLQAMALMQSPFVAKRVRAEGGTRVDALVRSSRSSRELVEEMFVSTLSRMPTSEETRVAVGWIDSDRRQGAEDLQWALLNKLDFIFNY